MHANQKIQLKIMVITHKLGVNLLLHFIKQRDQMPINVRHLMFVESILGSR